MKKTKLFKWVSSNLNILFCYCLFGIAFLLLLFVLIYHPVKDATSYLYDNGQSGVLSNVSFPLNQKIQIDNDNLNAIDIYMGDYSINDYNYRVELLGIDGKEYFASDYNEYGSNIIHIPLGNIKNSKNKSFIISFYCEECNEVNMSLVDSSDSKIVLENFEDKSLQITYNYFVKNNNYYWYIVLIVVFALTLLPLAKEMGEKVNEKG